jgi:hypothetical protein
VWAGATTDGVASAAAAATAVTSAAGTAAGAVAVELLPLLPLVQQGGGGRFVTDRRGWVVLTWYHAGAEGVSVVVVRGRTYLGCSLIPPFCSFPSPRSLPLLHLVGRALVVG